MTLHANNDPSGIERGSRHQRIRPLVALRALRKVLRDPEDTESGARLVLSLDGDRGEQNFLRFAAHPHGARVLSEQRNLVSALSDREQLRTLPGPSLGRAYLAFMEEEGLSIEGLEQAVAPVQRELEALFGELDAPRRLFSDRIGALHDLWHVVTGYSRDLIGELLVLAFSYEQLRTRAYGWMVPLGAFVNEFRIPGTRRLVAHARRRGRDAVWLATEDWESLLAMPLEEVRTRLGVGEPPSYTRYYRDPDSYRLIPEAAYRASRAV